MISVCFTTMMLAMSVTAIEHAVADSARSHAVSTTVSIDRDSVKWFLNGKPSNEGSAAEGLLLNARLIQGVFDDDNASTVGNWAYPDTKVWDADRNTDELAGNLSAFAAAGMNAFTVGLQGGSPHCYGNDHWVVSAFQNNGTIKTAWTDRLHRLLAAADKAGMVIIVQYFYYAQFSNLDAGADVVAIEQATSWLLFSGYSNFVVEVFNEKCTDVQAGYVDQVHTLARKFGKPLLVSSSCGGGGMPSPALVTAADFVLLHGNGHTPVEIAGMIAKVKAMPEWIAKPTPIVFNEDDHGFFNNGIGPESNLASAVAHHASWGFLCCCNGTTDGGVSHYVDSVGYQCPPVNWGLKGECLSGPRGSIEPNMTKQAWFEATKALVTPHHTPI
eukprot:m.178133 g.178133  ORF g.178133 m.178133 type:complete len:386 (-) comp31926_c1_seq1:304-1461(-)